MHPSLGRIVHVAVSPLENDGSPVAPAIITRVWDERTISAQVFLDTAYSPKHMANLIYTADLPQPPGNLRPWQQWTPIGNFWTWPPRM